MKIAVLCGGISPERNVSIAGGLAVAKALKEKGHEISLIDPAFGADGLINPEEIVSIESFPSEDELSKYKSRNFIDCINSSLFDDIEIAFNLLHGSWGEDGRIQALLELRGIPYTGSGVKASSMAMDKTSSKMLFIAAGIPTPAWAVVKPENFDNYEFYESLRTELGRNLVVKPNNQGSAIGINIIHGGNLDDIRNAAISAGKYSKLVLIEQYIEGRELTVGIIGDETLPVIEISPKEGFYDYTNKYTSGNTEYFCPAEVSEDISEFAQNITQSAFNLLGCSGFGRADFRLDEDNALWLLEMNTVPGFTSTSLLPKAALSVGIEFPDLCNHIIDLALEENNINVLNEEH